MPKKRRREDSALPSPAIPAVFAPDALQSSGPAASFKAALPYTHVKLPSLFDESTLLSVRKELQQLSSTFKETDLFKVYQTGDLGNLDASNPEHAALLPSTLALRSALYSPAFRSFVREVTGCAPITDKQDCSCNQYKQGGHLLCHDDVIGTRCVSYILYLARPGKAWRPQLGGALELYELREGSGEVLPSPVSAIAPEFGSMVLFTVQPGVSFHAVQEVASKAPRLSISGWFHAASPPEGADSNASLAQLQSASAGCAPPRALARAPKPRKSLTSVHEQKLGLVVNPAYLHASTIAALMAALSGQTPTHCASEVRRFRPGLDYTLAHTGTVRTAPTLDATLCFVACSAAELELWDSGDVGGFECHVQSSSEDEHGAAEVYQADEGSAGVTSIHAACNALSLVAREPNTMKFIKYVSYLAPSSRWDVTAEYTSS